MARYIDADKISSYIRENFSIDKTKNADICFAFIDFMNWLDEQPTADVVEVVRCKDCKHRYSSEYCECREENAYCSDGDRKEDV